MGRDGSPFVNSLIGFVQEACSRRANCHNEAALSIYALLLFIDQQRAAVTLWPGVVQSCATRVTFPPPLCEQNVCLLLRQSIAT